MILAGDFFFRCCSSVPSTHLEKLWQKEFRSLKSLVERVDLPAQIAL
jgi:hypothetical protein